MALLQVLLALALPGAASLKAPTTHTWAPQDLTKDRAGFAPIPEDDYVKQYERNRALWPVEFFVIVYRRIRGTAEILVRRSANGTSKYGVGTGAPATRWILSSQEAPRGYVKNGMSFAASNFPEFEGDVDWSYDKIDIRGDAFAGEDPELEAFAGEIRDGLRAELAARTGRDAWEQSTLSVVRSVLDKPNSLAAIQGTLRMSGAFAQKATRNAADLAKSVRIYTMFPTRAEIKLHAPHAIDATMYNPTHRSISTQVPADALTNAVAHRDARRAPGRDEHPRRAHEAERSRSPRRPARTSLHAHQYTKCLQYNTRRLPDAGRHWSSRRHTSGSGPLRHEGS